ncbi:MAG: transposase [Candidatus Nitrotoga sp.]
MVRILFLKRCHKFSNEQIEYQLLDLMSYQRFCRLTDSASIPDRTTVWSFEKRIGEVGNQALLDGMVRQLLKHVYIVRGGRHPGSGSESGLHPGRQETAQGRRHACNWGPAKHRQKGLEAT